MHTACVNFGSDIEHNGERRTVTQYLSDLPSRATALAAGALCRSSKLIIIKKTVWFLVSRLGQYHPSRLVLTGSAKGKAKGDNIRPSVGT